HVPSAMEPKQLDDSYSFKNVLTRYLDEVNTLQHDADAQIQRLVAGETDNLHEVTMAMDEAEASFELMMEIRRDLMKAYQDLMTMQ
ncbi:MAG: flagellar hook-basal body complex protein FliE, partial [Chlamydiia bacterium]|nr:flagellar hook-basal body complex protein FliE [Chlamydiia bacterium]